MEHARDGLTQPIIDPVTGAYSRALLQRRLAGGPARHRSGSLGVAAYPDDGDDPVALLGCADRRNYLAKRRGRGSAVADDADTGTATESSRLWERDGPLSAVHDFLTRVQ